MTVRHVVIVLAVGLLVAACDHGAMLVGDNRTDQELLARAVGHVWNGGSSGYQPTEIVAVLPPNKRLVIVELPFTGGFEVQRVDILAPDCMQIATLPVYGSEGTVVEIGDDLRVRLRDEYPQSGDPAETTDRCKSLPSAAPSSGPSAAASASP